MRTYEPYLIQLKLMVLLCTVLAVAVELELVIHNVEAAFLFDFVPDVIQEIIGKFSDLATAQADEVVMGMVDIPVIQFVPAPAVAEIELFQKFQLREKFQRPINRGQSDIRIVHPYDFIHIFGAHVVFPAVQEGLQDNLPLVCEFILMFPDFLLQGIHDCCFLHASRKPPVT